MNAGEIFDRLYELTGVKSDVALAKELGVTPQAIANSRKRASVPYEKICTYAEERGYSLDYIFMGKETEHGSTGSEPLSQLKSWAYTGCMADLLHFIFQELDKELFLKEQISESDPFWFMANVYRKVMTNLPDGALPDSEEALELAKLFSEEEVDHYNRMLAIALRNADRKDKGNSSSSSKKEPLKPGDPEDSSPGRTAGIRQNIKGESHQVAGGDIENNGGVHIGKRSKE